VAIAAPAFLLAIARGAALILAIFGQHPLWPDQHLNLSEAAAMRDDAEVVRWIEQGEDPNIKREIRGGLLFDDSVVLTPLEAAVEAGNATTVTVLLRAGALLDTEAWKRLRCDTERTDVAAALDAHRPVGVALGCASAGPT
jgi:hypothetical protein